jgi:hypothetical protein
MTHVREGGFPMVRGEKDFLVASSCFGLHVHVEKSELPREPASVEVFGGHDVRKELRNVSVVIVWNIGVR